MSEKIGHVLYRFAEIESVPAGDMQSRTVSLTFSSEAPAQRWYGAEVLLHGAENVVMSRLQSMGSVLMNHDADQIVGRVVGAEVGADRRGHATIEMDDDDEGRKALGKIRSGSLRGVSVAYWIIAGREVPKGAIDEETKTAGPALIATRWEPLEISLTPVPMDATVGVGRAAERRLETLAKGELRQMDEKLRLLLVALGLKSDASEAEALAFAEEVTAKVVGGKLALKAPEDPEAEEEPEEEAEPEDKPKDDDAAKAAEGFQRALKIVLTRGTAVGCGEYAAGLLADGKSLDEITDAILAHARAQRSAPAGAVPDVHRSAADQLTDDDVLGALRSPGVLVE